MSTVTEKSIRKAMAGLTKTPLELSSQLCDWHYEVTNHDTKRPVSKDEFIVLSRGINQAIEHMLTHPIHMQSHIGIINLSMALDILTHSKRVNVVSFPIGKQSIFNVMVDLLNRFAADSTLIQDNITNIISKLRKCVLVHNVHPKSDPETFDSALLIDPYSLGYAINKFNLPLIEKHLVADDWVIISKVYDNKLDEILKAPYCGPYRNIVTDQTLHSLLVALYCNPKTNIDLYTASGIIFDYINTVHTIALNNGLVDHFNHWNVLKLLVKTEKFFLKRHPSISYLYDILHLSDIELPENEKK